MSNSSYDESLLIQGSQYTVGTNDGKEFKKVAFVGLKQLNGKPMMVFKTNENKQVSINPSFHSFIILLPNPKFRIIKNVDNFD